MDFSRLIERAREALLNIDGKIESSKRGHLPTTYTNMLACINGVTEATAIAISRAFPTWAQLLNGYKGCRNLQERKLLLCNIPVSQDSGLLRTESPSLARSSH